ncbi:MAG: hypothetical protein SGPRY_014456 [Prymnesium sp.]
MHFLYLMLRTLVHFCMSMLETPWRYLESKAELLSAEAQASAERSDREASAPAAGAPPRDSEEGATDKYVPFMSTAELLVQRAQLREELRLAEIEEDPL